MTGLLKWPTAPALLHYILIVKYEKRTIKCHDKNTSISITGSFKDHSETLVTGSIDVK